MGGNDTRYSRLFGLRSHTIYIGRPRSRCCQPDCQLECVTSPVLTERSIGFPSAIGYNPQMSPWSVQSVYRWRHCWGFWPPGCSAKSVNVGAPRPPSLESIIWSAKRNNYFRPPCFSLMIGDVQSGSNELVERHSILARKNMIRIVAWKLNVFGDIMIGVWSWTMKVSEVFLSAQTKKIYLSLTLVPLRYIYNAPHWGGAGIHTPSPILETRY